MPPKEAAIDNNRLVLLEKAVHNHDEGLDMIKDSITRLEERQSRDINKVTEAIAKLGELSVKGDAVPVQPAIPLDRPQMPTTSNLGRLNPEAESLLGSSPTFDPFGSDIERGLSTQEAPVSPKLPRVDFPKFSGSNVRMWLQKVNRFFLLYPMMDKQRILYASLYFTDAAEIWFQTDATRFASLGWLEFSNLLQHRFEDDLHTNVIGEFKNLCQKGTVLEYQQLFEQLRPLVLLQNPGLTEMYFVSSCIAGLRDDIRHQVQMFYPTSVNSVFALARLQEAALDQKYKPRYNKGNSASNSFQSQYKYNSNISTAGNSNASSKFDSVPVHVEPYTKSQPTVAPQIKRLTPTEIQERRAKGLCYNCDDIWTLKHRCKSKQLFLIVGDVEETTELSDTASDPALSDSSAPAMPAEVAISLQALSGNTSYQKLLLKGRVRNRSLTMLVDTGSTQNFLDTNTAKALGCICSDTPAHQVMVAGGSHLTCDKVSQNFCWTINDV